MSGRRWTGRFAQSMTAQTLATYGTTCWLCGGEGATTADHVLPQSLGGSHDIENLRPAHARCNSARGNRIATAKRRGQDLSGFFVTTTAPPADDERENDESRSGL